jgi:hypothetical protein
VVELSPFTANAKVTESRSVIAYTDNDSVVLYDEYNPLSYIEAESAVSLDKAR